MNLWRGRAGAVLPALLALSLTRCIHARPVAPPASGSQSSPQPAPLDRLHRDIDAVLDAPDLQRGTWGVLVQSLTNHDTLYARNAGSLLVPASNQKIVTLATAADRLGWDYTFETRLARTGTIDGGVLNGDLIVIGGGDPSLSESDGSARRLFDEWADGLKRLGVHTVSGRIVGDDNAFDDELFGSGWMWDDMDQAFSAGIGALQINRNATALTIAPGSAPGAPAKLSLSSDGSGLTFRNRVATAAPGTAPRIVTRRLANRRTLEVTGTIPQDAGAIERIVAVANPTLYYVSIARRALAASGIQIEGEAVDIDDLRAADTAAVVLLFSHRSPPLSALADTLMKLSQNQYAETLLETLGAQAGEATFEGGRRVVRERLAAWGIPASEFVLADGSGLSRYDLVTAQALVTILTHIDGDARLKEPFAAALPVAGAPGMLAERLKGTVAAGTLRAKTGSMGNVRSISGYMRTADNEPVVFSVIANNYGIAGGEIDRAADAVLLEVARFRRSPADPGLPPR